MPIKSYIAFPAKGQRSVLSKELNKLPWCEAIPAENKDVLVLVTDTKDQKEEDLFQEKLNKIKSLDHLTLVSGFNDPGF
ncbi:hypothetical protein QQ008_13045 [Fulvivirgaceae bacterium BMA10]|uniref:Uncharacterized protein n=1 Tax=Splendidivirga corallicola TaxID=3051826 RepID=A0ABT8KS60_9BACT|nr:hypothetical protein [Fulvivirgaceae bacterium BMA10]